MASTRLVKEHLLQQQEILLNSIKLEKRFQASKLKKKKQSKLIHDDDNDDDENVQFAMPSLESKDHDEKDLLKSMDKKQNKNHSKKKKILYGKEKRDAERKQYMKHCEDVIEDLTTDHTEFNSRILVGKKRKVEERTNGRVVSILNRLYKTPKNTGKSTNAMRNRIVIG